MPKFILIPCFLAMICISWCLQYWYTAWLIWFAYIPFLIILHQLKPSIYKASFVAFLLIYVSYCLAFNWYLAIPRYQLLIALAVVVESAVSSLSYIIYLFIERRTKNPRTIWLLPFLLVMVEYAWRHLDLMPPILLGHTQASLTFFTQYVDVVGVEGASFFVMLVNVAVFRSLQLQHSFQKIILRLALILSIPFGYSLVRIYQFNDETIKKEGLTITLFRLNMPAEADDFLETTKADLSRLERDIYLTDSISYYEKKANERSDLYVWHEGAFPLKIKKVEDFVNKIIKENNMPVLTGIEQFDRQKPNSIINGSMVFYPDGSRSALYTKMKFVNFWENDCTRGKEHIMHQVKNKNSEVFKIGTPICIEQFTPEHWAAFRRKGVDIFVQICFETWFGYGIGVEPGISNMTALRCMENKIYGARTSNGGAAAFFDPLGRRYASTTTDEVLKNTIYKSNFPITIYAKFPWLPICLVFLGFWIMFFKIREN